jgi:hypothetical protein
VDPSERVWALLEELGAPQGAVDASSAKVMLAEAPDEAVQPGGMGLRAEVRRLPHPRRGRRRPGAAGVPERQRPDGVVPRDRPGAGAAPLPSLRGGRRGGGARRAGGCRASSGSRSAPASPARSTSSAPPSSSRPRSTSSTASASTTTTSARSRSWTGRRCSGLCSRPPGRSASPTTSRRRGRSCTGGWRRWSWRGSSPRRPTRPTAPGRSRDWLKIRADLVDDFVVVGWTDPKRGRAGFGALHLAAYEDNRLVYAGRVGSGFSGDQLDETLDDARAAEVDAARGGRVRRRGGSTTGSPRPSSPRSATRSGRTTAASATPSSSDSATTSRWRSA